jgi:hypothetical protein
MSKRQRKRAEKRRRHRGEQPLVRSIATGAGVTVGATLLMGGAAQAACTCTVDSLSDPTQASHTTLRDAITSANANPYSTIIFDSSLSGTITLNNTELPQITAPGTVIQGPGGGQIKVDGANTSRIFDVSATDATISGLTIQNGNAAKGGGIYLQAGQLTVANSVVTGDTATGDGGGIYVHTGNLTVDSSTISDNHSGNFGGGIGGSSSAGGFAGPTTVRNSTLSGNHAELGGGAYFNFKSAATVENSTVYENYADVGVDGRGGGLYHAGQGGGPGLVVTGSTISKNHAFIDGGGVASGGAPSTYIRPTIRDSIVAGNYASPGPDLAAYNGGNPVSMSVGFSLIGTVDSAVVITPIGPNLLNQNPQLGPLTDNGGPTETQKPATTSPVIDAGSAFGLARDQRGVSRPFDAIPANVPGGDASDIGAVELQSSEIAAAPPPATTPPTTPSSPVTRKKCKKKKHKRSAESAKTKCKKKK